MKKEKIEKKEKNILTKLLSHGYEIVDEFCTLEPFPFGGGRWFCKVQRWEDRIIRGVISRALQNFHASFREKEVVEKDILSDFTWEVESEIKKIIKAEAEREREIRCEEDYEPAERQIVVKHTTLRNASRGYGRKMIEIICTISVGYDPTDDYEL